MSRAFGVTNESKSSSDYTASKTRMKLQPVYKNEQNLNVNLITKLDLEFVKVINENGKLDPSESLFGDKPCQTQNYLRYLVAR